MTEQIEELELRKKQLTVAMAELDRQFGKGSVLRLGAENIEPWPCIETGALTLDIALGGGIPKGRIVEIFGPESSGKSTLCLSVIANAQAAGGICGFIDAEHALDPVYGRTLGVDFDELIFSQPDYGEQAIDIATKLVRTGSLAVLVVDSVAALTPKAELEGDMEDSQMGLLPRLMAKAMRRLVGIANETGTTIIFTNQLREKIGVMFGNPETQPGGRALKFAASVRIDLRRVSDIKDAEGNILGVTTVAKIPKNKMAPPLKRAEFDIVYGRGINKLGCLLTVAVERGIVKKSGSWYSYNDSQLGQGPTKAVAAMASDMAMTEEIKRATLDL